MKTKVGNKKKPSHKNKSAHQPKNTRDVGAYQGHIYDRVSKLSSSMRVWPD